MTQYRYRPSRFGNKLVLQRGVAVSTEAPEHNQGPRNPWPVAWRDVSLTDLPNAYIAPTGWVKTSGGMRYWRLRRGWCGTLVLQLSDSGSDWEDARLQDLSMSTTMPVPA